MSKQVKIVAEMACKPEPGMYEPAPWVAGSKNFYDRFDSIAISEPDKIIFVASVNSDQELDSLIYDIEDHFNALDVDYMDVRVDDEDC